MHVSNRGLLCVTRAKSLQLPGLLVQGAWDVRSGENVMLVGEQSLALSGHRVSMSDRAVRLLWFGWTVC